MHSASNLVVNILAPSVIDPDLFDRLKRLRLLANYFPSRSAGMLRLSNPEVHDHDLVHNRVGART